LPTIFVVAADFYCYRLIIVFITTEYRVWKSLKLSFLVSLKIYQSPLLNMGKL